MGIVGSGMRERIQEKDSKFIIPQSMTIKLICRNDPIFGTLIIDALAGFELVT
jgi:hypothetical protein